MYPMAFLWSECRALGKENSRNGAPDKAPDLLLREWLNGSPQSIRAGSHVVLNFDTNPSAADRCALAHSCRHYIRTVCLCTVENACLLRLASVLHQHGR